MRVPQLVGRLVRVAGFGLAVIMTAVAGYAQPPAGSVQSNSGGVEKYGPPLPSEPNISFAFERPGLLVPSYTISVQGAGGRYVGTELLQPGRYGGTAVPQPFDRSFPVSAATGQKIVALAHELKNFNVVCATKMKNIADTGKKKLSYLGPQDQPPFQGECTYNYSESKSVQELTTIFQAMAETMDAGRSLDHLHRYDRLGLDAALGSLADEVASGRAMELGTIADSLRSIVADTELMQRVRARATALLARVPADVAKF